MQIDKVGKYLTHSKQCAEVVGISKSAAVGFVNGNPCIWDLQGRIQFGNHFPGNGFNNNDIFCKYIKELEEKIST